MIEITLIRHTAVDVLPGTCYGQSDVPLRDTFEEEAAATARELERFAPFDQVYTSPLSRCTRLATYCGYPQARPDRRLLEIDFGEWEMQPFAAIRDPRLTAWYNDYLHVPATGGESFAMQYERVARFLDELRHSSYRRVACFAHGGVLICAQIYAGVLRPEEAFSALTPYGGIVNLTL